MFMDAGEFGFGALASPLALGLDVPENATLLDAVISAALPDPELPVIPLPLDNVIGVFERLTGNPAWRHYEFLAPGGPQYEGRAEVELVVRMAAQVGNYDYLIDWIFTQGGVIRTEVHLTGVDILKGVVSTSVGDLVMWVTLGFHHLTAAEDFPVLPRERASFELRPTHFFDRNPALDLRRAPFEVQ